MAGRSPALDALTMMSRKPLRSNVSASSRELLMTSSALSTLTFVMLCSTPSYLEQHGASQTFSVALPLMWGLLWQAKEKHSHMTIRGKLLMSKMHLG